MTLELFKADAEASRAQAIRAAEVRALAEAKLRKLEADFTPRPVVRAILEWYFAHVLRLILHRPHDAKCPGCHIGGSAPHSCPDPTEHLLVQQRGSVLSRPTKVVRLLDVCAGAGVWASEIRRLFAILGIAVHITAVELDEERETEYLPRHADEVAWMGWREFARKCKAEGRWFDLIVGNPAFTQARALEVAGELDPSTSMPAVLTEITGALILYMSQQGWTKTEAGFLVRELYPPAFAVDVPGAVNHRAGLNPKGKRWSADDKPYSASMWIGKLAGPHAGLTATGMLAPMKGRSWREGLRPGAEPDEWLHAEGIPYLEVHCTRCRRSSSSPTTRT